MRTFYHLMFRQPALSLVNLRYRVHQIRVRVMMLRFNEHPQRLANHEQPFDVVPHQIYAGLRFFGLGSCLAGFQGRAQVR
jgi:hypothetical protein